MKKSTLRSLTALILIFAALFTLISCGVDKQKETDKKAIENAEKFANQLFYTSLGLAAKKTDSEIIYRSGDQMLIVVKLYLTDSSRIADGSVCVKINYGVAVNSTDVKAPDFPYKNHLDEIKASFGM